MKRDDDQLERLITNAVRGTPHRSAPATLERRILNALDRRSTEPWWRKEFARWPPLARMAFLVACAGLAYVALAAPLWLWESSRDALPTEVSLLQTLALTVRVIVKHLPSVLVYSALAALVALYGVLFGVGA
ncbi:MAG TPA: hypothetical protein VHK24_02235, partial [Steroidobacter sp.]|nr:hypothetical protein [Steroidobacter sp.]